MYIELPPTIVTPDKEPAYGPGFGGGYNVNTVLKIIYGLDPSEPPFTRHRVAQSMIKLSKDAKASIEHAFASRLHSLPTTLESELEAYKNSWGEINPQSYQDQLGREKAQVDAFIEVKRSQLYEKQQQANVFFGSDPLSKSDTDLKNVLFRNLTIDLKNSGYEAWGTSYNAAYSVKIHTESIALLTNKSHALAQLQAQEATRVANEQARIAAEAEQRARVAAVAEAQRILDAEATRIAAKQSRISEQAQAQTPRTTFAAPARLSATGTVALTVAGSVTALDAAFTLQAAIRAAAVVAGEAVASVAAGFALGVSALVYSPKLGDGELPPSYLLNTPLSDLVPDLDVDLNAKAAAGEWVDLPVRVASTQTVDRTNEAVIIKTDGVTVASAVRVLPATYDAERNTYSVTTADAHPITLTWTPAVDPDTNSTTLPVDRPSAPVYAGATVTPVEGWIETFPATSLSLRDLIIVFPAASGLDPVYTMFSSPYKGATTKGEHSGRYYNPEKSGGPTQHLDWSTVTITQEGIDLVKLHTGRFGYSPGNAVMIDRLEKIMSGQLSTTDVDKRFYTHEIRELERYRVAGITDGTVPWEDDARWEVWNNTHAAALEDYKLRDDETLLYSTEALSAEMDYTYEDLLK